MLKARANLKKRNNDPYSDREGLVYCRVSSKKQEIEGHGLEGQEERCKNDLRSIKVPYVKTFSDSYTGGGDFMNRPAMKALIEYIDSRPHKKFVIVFDDLKRFARDVEFHIKLRACFRSRDVLLRCLNYNFDESPEGEFAELIMAGQAELERKQNKRQVTQKMKARLENGYWTFGKKKGYTITSTPGHGKLAVVNKEGKILKIALEGFANGSYARKIDVCNFLVDSGFWKKQSPEKYIDKLTNILKDSFYAGYIEYPKWEVSRRAGQHKGIISLDTFNLIQKRLCKVTLGKRIRTDISDDFPLRGLLVCADCGSPLTGGWSRGRNKRYPYYHCQNKSCISYGKSIEREAIEAGYLEILKEMKLRGDVSTLISKTFDRVWKEEVDTLNSNHKLLLSKKKELEDKMIDLTNLLISSKNSTLKNVYERQLEKLGGEIDGVESGIVDIDDVDDVPYRTALDKAIGLLKNPYNIWIELTTREKHDLFYFIFNGKLQYSINNGYRTSETSTAIKLFDSFIDTKPLDVDPRGIEPRTHPCHGRVLPLYYGPDMSYIICIFQKYSIRD